jgi:hypothetical protein
MACKLLLEVSGGLVDREQALKKMTKTVGQGSIRQDRVQCNIRPASNLPDKALAYEVMQALKWRMVFVHGYHLHRKDAEYAEKNFNENK